MTTEEQNVAIAEACGKLATPERKPTIEELEAILASKDQLKVELMPDGSVMALPDYLNDLNAMREAEKTLEVSDHNSEQTQLQSYAIKLAIVSVRAGNDYIWQASAGQRAEAFLRTIGKWKE